MRLKARQSCSWLLTVLSWPKRQDSHRVGRLFDQFWGYEFLEQHVYFKLEKAVFSTWDWTWLQGLYLSSWELSAPEVLEPLTARTWKACSRKGRTQISGYCSWECNSTLSGPHILILDCLKIEHSFICCLCVYLSNSLPVFYYVFLFE